MAGVGRRLGLPPSKRRAVLSIMRGPFQPSSKLSCPQASQASQSTSRPYRQLLRGRSIIRMPESEFCQNNSQKVRATFCSLAAVADDAAACSHRTTSAACLRASTASTTHQSTRQTPFCTHVSVEDDCAGRIANRRPPGI